MNPKGKKLISLFLVFSLMMLSVSLYAKERRGAKLIILRKGDQVRLIGTPWEEMTGVRGELIAVKQDSLLLMDAEGKDVSVDIVDIEAIRIVKESKALSGAGIGLLVCGAIGAALGVAADKMWNDGENPVGAGFLVGGVVGGIGALIGAIGGASLRKYKTIQIEGMTDLEIQEALDEIRKKARVPNYK